MFRADSGIVQAGRNGMGRCDLAVSVLEQIAFRSLKYADGSVVHKTRSVFAKVVSKTAGFHSDHSNIVFHEFMKQPDRIRPAADAGDQNIRQSAFFFQDLFTSFFADDALKIPHHQWIRMWAERRTKEVI